MKLLNIARTAPLNQDSEGTIRLRGSRVTLDTLVRALKNGNTPEQIQQGFPSLSLAQINGAIAWYLNHQAAVEEYLKERDVEAESVRRDVESRPDHAELRETIRQRREQLIKR